MSPASCGRTRTVSSPSIHKEKLMESNSSSSQRNTTDLPAGRFLVLDEEFVASLDEGQLQQYLGVLTRAASGTHADVDALAQALADEFDHLDLPMPPVQVKMIAEQLFGVQDARLDIATTGGELLVQQDGVVGVPERRGSAADPEHPDRPLIS